LACSYLVETALDHPPTFRLATRLPISACRLRISASIASRETGGTRFSM
jgi:hypothetical protein